MYSYPIDGAAVELRMSGDLTAADEELLSSWFDLVKKSVLKTAQRPQGGDK